MMRQPAPKTEADSSLAIRAAWLHFAGGLTQAEVATRLGVSGIKAHRLIAQASQSGAVKISVEGEISGCLDLEDRLSDRFGLTFCQVVPDLGEAGLPLRTLGVAGAALLRREIVALPDGIIGVGHGRTLAAGISALARIDAPTVRFVSLLGGLTRNLAANPHDVMHRLAEKTGADAYVLPVPFMANTPQDRAVLLAQRGVGDVVELAARADLLIVGVGTATPDAQLVASKMVTVAEIAEVQRAGAVGEVLGHYFDHDGAPVESSLAARTISPDLATLRGRRIIAVAGGAVKVAGLRAVLRSGCLSGLVTDEATALAMMNGKDAD